MSRTDAHKREAVEAMMRRFRRELRRAWGAPQAQRLFVEGFEMDKLSKRFYRVVDRRRPGSNRKRDSIGEQMWAWRLCRHIEDLPHREREIVTRYYVLGQSLEATAHAVGWQSASSAMRAIYGRDGRPGILDTLYGVYAHIGA